MYWPSDNNTANEIINKVHFFSPLWDAVSCKLHKYADLSDLAVICSKFLYGIESNAMEYDLKWLTMEIKKTSKP